MTTANTPELPLTTGTTILFSIGERVLEGTIVRVCPTDYEVAADEGHAPYHCPVYAVKPERIIHTDT